MPSKGSHQAHLLLGALLGSLAASASYLLLTTKKGEELRDSASDGIKTLKNKLEDFIETTIEEGESVASGLSEKTDEYGDKIRSFLMQISDQLESLKDREGKDKLTLLLIGGVLGAILGAGAGSLLAQDKEREGHFNVSNIASYAAVIREVLNSLEERKPQRRASSLNTEKINELLDFALTGLTLWQKFQKKE